jgi:hypothetical protein
MEYLYREGNGKSPSPRGLFVPTIEHLESPPRRVRLSSQGTIAASGAILYMVVLVLGLGSIVRDGARLSPNMLLFFFALFVFSPVFVWAVVRILLEKKLLQFGSCSTGKVVDVHAERSRGSSRNKIRYEFPVGGHKPMTGHGPDKAGTYKVGSPVMVFYDPSDISKHVAICSTFWMVGGKDGQFLNP